MFYVAGLLLELQQNKQSKPVIHKPVKTSHTYKTFLDEA